MPLPRPEDYVDLALRVHDKFTHNMPDHVDKDALLGAALESLVVRCARYDEGRWPDVRTYLTFNVYNAMKDELRKSTEGRSFRNEGLGYSSVHFISANLRVNGADKQPIEMVETFESRAMTTDALIEWLDVLVALGAPSKKLTSQESFAMAHWLLGWPAYEISEELGVSVSRVTQILDNAWLKVWPGNVRGIRKRNRRGREDGTRDTEGPRARLAA